MNHIEIKPGGADFQKGKVTFTANAPTSLEIGDMQEIIMGTLCEACPKNCSLSFNRPVKETSVTGTFCGNHNDIHEKVANLPCQITRKIPLE